MADTNAQEPTMEEILASIRRIISEDDAPAEKAAEPAAAEHEPEPVLAHEPEPDLAPEFEEDDVLELTEKFEAVAAEPAPAAPPVTSLGDLDVFSAPPEPLTVAPAAPAAPPAPPPAPAPRTAAASLDDALLSAPVAESAASHFGKLARTVAMPAEGRDLEAVVRELLRPLLKDWLDENLPAIVESQVQAEVERIARRR